MAIPPRGTTGRAGDFSAPGASPGRVTTTHPWRPAGQATATGGSSAQPTTKAALDIQEGHAKGKLSVEKSPGTAAKTVQQYGGVAGVHSYVVEEAAAFAAHITGVLSSSPAWSAGLEGHLPLAGPDDLFTKLADGLVLCRFINVIAPDTIDERALNWPKGTGPPAAQVDGTQPAQGQQPSSARPMGPKRPSQTRMKLNPFEMAENINVALNSARSIGCTVVNVHAADVIAGSQGGKQHLVLGLVWQVVRAQLLAKINLKEHPELARLLREGETIKDLLALPPEEVLLRWFNFHLAKEGWPAIGNLGPAVQDGAAYWHLLHSIDPTCLPRGLDSWAGAAETADPVARASAVINAAGRLGAGSFITPMDIASGNRRLNLAFTASIFNTAPGLAELQAEESAAVYQSAGLLDDDSSDAREARQFRYWLNSLALGPPGAEPIVLHNLFAELADGLPLLYALDKVAGPGTVDWKRINTDPSRLNKFKRVENCNQAVALGKGLGFSLPGIAGSDLHDGNPKLCLGFLWQLMRLQIMRMLSAIAGSEAAPVAAGGPAGPSAVGKAGPARRATTARDSDIIDWANTAVKDVLDSGRLALPPSASPPSPITSFKDPGLTSGLYLLAVLAYVEPRGINPELLTPGHSQEDKTANAKYIISVARKLGAVVFCTYEDIVEARPKMLQQFLAALMYRARQGQAGQEGMPQEPPMSRTSSTGSMFGQAGAGTTSATGQPPTTARSTGAPVAARYMGATSTTSNR